MLIEYLFLSSLFFLIDVKPVSVVSISKKSDIAFEFVLYNDIIDPVEVKWKDFVSETRRELTLKPKETHTFDSYIGHDWLLQSGSFKQYYTLGEGMFEKHGAIVRVSQLNPFKSSNTGLKPTQYDRTQQTSGNQGQQQVPWNQGQQGMGWNQGQQGMGSNQGQQGMGWNQGQQGNNGADLKKLKLNDFKSGNTGIKPTQYDRTQQTSGSDGSSCNSQFQTEMLNQHNKARSKHGVSQMRLSDELNRFAIKAAENSASLGRLTQSINRNNMGENLGALLGGGNSKRCADMAIQIFNMWYKGEKSYDYNAATFSTSSGLFTQVVWAASTELGCGVSCKNTYCYVTCNYRNPGNVIGQFSKNVFRPNY